MLLSSTSSMLALYRALPAVEMSLRAIAFFEGTIKTMDDLTEALCDFIHRYHRVPMEGERYRALGVGKWCAQLRDLHHRGEPLPPGVREALEAIPLWSWETGPLPPLRPFNVRVCTKRDLCRVWYFRCQILYAFVRYYQRMPRSNERFENLSVGKWIVSARALYRENDLPPNLVQAFEEIPGWTWKAPLGRPSVSVTPVVP